MAKVKFSNDTAYIANHPEDWESLKNAPMHVSYQMYKDLLFANSGALLLHERIGWRFSNDARMSKVTFVYPYSDTEAVCDNLYDLLRDGSKNDGITFNGKFRYTIIKVKGSEVDMNQDLIGLEIRFIK